MRKRLRLGAAAAIGLGALLLATVLASPALAWHSNVEASAKCLDSGKIGVHYTVTPWEEGHDATVYVFYKLDDGTGGKAPGGTFDEDHPKVEGDFELPEGTTGTVTVFAVAKWKDDKNPSKNESKPVELPDKCKGHESTTSTTAPPTTAPPTTAPPTTAPPTTTPPSSSVSPTTSLETTTSAAVGAATSTTSGGGQLPFTGNSSGPMLLAGILLVGGGSLFLLISRAREGHATK
jgi:hypothetical protein